MLNLGQIQRKLSLVRISGEFELSEFELAGGFTVFSLVYLYFEVWSLEDEKGLLKGFTRYRWIRKRIEQLYQSTHKMAAKRM